MAGVSQPLCPRDRPPRSISLKHEYPKASLPGTGSESLLPVPTAPPRSLVCGAKIEGRSVTLAERGGHGQNRGPVRGQDGNGQGR